MSVPSDITNLFELFGGSAEGYQELSTMQQTPNSQSHLPTSTGTGVGVKPVEGSPQVAQQVDSSRVAHDGPDLVLRGQKADAPWTPLGLQGLLAGLTLQECQSSSESVTPQPSAVAPDLQHIRVLAVVSAKGGVGKSTLAANLAMILAKAGSPVVAIDLDPQNSLRLHFRATAEYECPAYAGLAVAGDNLSEQCLRSEEGVVVFPYGLIDEARRSAFEQGLANDPHWLAKLLADLQLAKGTVVVIDTPTGPSLGLQQALSLANLALVVSLADAASYTTLPMIERLVEAYTQGSANFMGSSHLINQVDDSHKLNQYITQIMQGLLGSRLVGLVHADQVIGEALAYNLNVLEHAPNGLACQDIVRCAQVLAERLAPESLCEQIQ